MIVRALVIWIGIASAETLHGILRVRFLNPLLGDRGARRAAVFSGAAIILAIGWVSMPWIAPSGRSDCMMVGTLWLALMLGYDIGLARFAFRLPYERIVSDFDIRKGNLLSLGMAILFATPLLISEVRGLY